MGLWSEICWISLGHGFFMKPRVKIVVQRYGEEVNGGAELHARWLAEHLSAVADVEVLTTCALDYQTWANHFEAGGSMVGEIPVQRFSVDKPRNWKRVQRGTRKIVLGEPSVMEEIDWMREQGPNSEGLLRAIASAYDETDVFIFFSHIYAQTVYGLPLVNDKAILVPTAHDDPFVRLRVFRPTFHLPRAIAYNTETEKRLVEQVSGNAGVRSAVVGIGINAPGIGINAPDEAKSQRFRKNYGIEGAYLLYVGRIAPSKNIPALLEEWVAFKESWEGKPLTLVLAGKNHLDLPEREDVKAVGFISEQDKFDGIVGARAVVMPSTYESLSMIVLESWLMGTPTLVNGECAVLKDQTRLSGGGLYYGSSAEFTATLTRLLSLSDADRTMLGESGKRFVQNRYNWERIVGVYQALFDEIIQP